MQEEFASKIGTKVAEQLQGFNELMQRVIDNYETWAGVTERFQCKIRLTPDRRDTVTHGSLVK